MTHGRSMTKPNFSTFPSRAGSWICLTAEKHFWKELTAAAAVLRFCIVIMVLNPNMFGFSSKDSSFQSLVFGKELKIREVQYSISDIFWNNLSKLNRYLKNFRKSKQGSKFRMLKFGQLECWFWVCPITIVMYAAAGSGRIMEAHGEKLENPLEKPCHQKSLCFSDGYFPVPTILWTISN